MNQKHRYTIFVFSGLCLSSLACADADADAPRIDPPAARPNVDATPPPNASSMPDAGGSADAARDALSVEASTADNGAPSDVYPAPHPAPPIIPTAGGPVLKAMKIVSVYFPGEEHAAELTRFAKTFGATPFYAATTEEYGVGPATGGGAITVKEPAPATITDDGIQAFLKSKIGHDASWGKADANTAYVLYYPAATKITVEDVTICEGALAYHGSVRTDAALDVPYAVIPRCASDPTGLTGIDILTASASHELIEIATDPLPLVNPAYSLDIADLGWVLAIGGGETADLCAVTRSSYYKPAGFDFFVQRSWSNKLAQAGHDPCAPAVGGDPYFNAAVVLPDLVPIGEYGKARAVRIPVGASRTIEVDLFSDARTAGAWEVQAYAPPDPSSRTATLEFTFDRTSGVNGEKLNLTIKALARGKYGGESFLLISKLGSAEHLWAGFVAN